MSRFYFDLHNGEGPTRDTHGVELASRENVSKEVTRILLDIARDEMPIKDRTVISVTVRDAVGRAISVASLTFTSEWLDAKRPT